MTTEPVVVIPCSARKAPRAVAPAGEMYVGSYHRMARRAAEVLTRENGVVLVLSARFGLLRLDEEIEHYDLMVGEPGTVVASVLRRQAAGLGVTRTAVTVLAGRAYANLACQVWPGAHTPLLGTRGIGEQRAILAAIIKEGMNS
jgi:hypothetical protein